MSTSSLEIDLRKGSQIHLKCSGSDSITRKECEWLIYHGRYSGMSRCNGSIKAVLALLGLSFLSACGGSSSDSADPLVIGAATANESVNPTDPEFESGNAASGSGDGGSVSLDALTLAIASGDASVVQDASLLETALVDAIDSAANLHRDTINTLFNLDESGSAKADGSSLTSIDWNPTHDAAILDGVWGENTNLLVTNSVIKSDYEVTQHPMAIFGVSDARYMVFGGNPMRNYYRDATSVNGQMHQLLENSLAWLVDSDDLANTPSTIVAAQLSQGYYFPDEVAVRVWLDERYQGKIKYNEPNACDDIALAACLNDETDLLIISNHTDGKGDEQAIAATVKLAMGRGIPVLYLHVDGNASTLSDHLLPLFDVSHAGDNYWRNLGFSAFDVRSQRSILSDDVRSVRTMARNFKNQNFDVDWSACDGENCSDNVSLNTAFMDGAKYTQSLMRDLDRRKTNVFEFPSKYRFLKILALLGDHYRMHTNFPMDRDRTPTVEFLKALFADFSAYQYRKQVGSWSDLGNFSRTDFSHITPTTRSVSHTSKKKFKSTGAYALPGQTVKATRNDTNAVSVSVFINSLRDGSTHVFAENGYKRPKFMQSQKIEILPGESIEFPSAIGGPIHLAYDGNDVQIDVVFENVGEHPFWRDPADSSSFEHKLQLGNYDWAEIAAPSFEVHSTREKMIDSLNNPMFGVNRGTPQQLVDATMQYVHNYPHVLAGFKGPGIDVVDEIHQFADKNGLSVENLDLVKHMNADQASCGYGCSGNPYDAYWSFSPIGHGDIHELGHGLERKRFRFSGWPGHTSTNYYSYYTKSQYHKNTGNEPDCQALPFESQFNILQSSFAQADPAAYVKVNMWDSMGWSEGTAMVIQMMMAAQDNGALIDGWHLLARMHIIERSYQLALKNDESWMAMRTGLGMGQYDRETARSMSAEDWLLIAVSHATGFDFRAYFDVWAHAYSNQAAAQVAAMMLPTMPLNFYVSSGDGYCKGQGFDGNKLPLDGGDHAWPITGL